MPITVGQDTAKTRKTLTAGGASVAYYSIPAAEAAGLGEFSNLPAALKVVLENMLRFEDGKTVHVDDIKAFSDWGKMGGKNPREIAYRPARVLLQDFTGVPAVVDLAAMRDAIIALGGDAEKINPLNPVDLVIDHSVMIDEFGNPRAFQMNVDREYERNMERYTFLKWGQTAFNNFRVVPPGTGICHQVNLEYLAQTVWTDTDQTGAEVAYPDTLVGTDSHTTMVNGMAVLGWGVGGIEAEAAMLGQPISMLIPEVIGFKLTGKMIEGTTATDLVLKVVQMLRKKGVVGKFVEFYGDGLDHVPLADRATIGNMAPEYGATCGFFPIDDETLRYLKQTGRDEDRIALVEAYAKENGMWRSTGYSPIYTDTLELDMGTIVPAISGPKRPQDYTPLTQSADSFLNVVGEYRGIDITARCRCHGVRGSCPHRHRSAQIRRRRGRGLQAARRLCRDRLDHVLHQHLEPLRDDRCRSGGSQGARVGSEPQALGQDLAGAGLAGRQRLSGGREPAGGSGRHRLQPGRLWLHHLHRQLRPAATRDQQGDRRQRPDRDLRAVGQPQLRGPDFSPMCAPTIWPRRRWWWPMRWPAT